MIVLFKDSGFDKVSAFAATLLQIFKHRQPCNFDYDFLKREMLFET